MDQQMMTANKVKLTFLSRRLLGLATGSSELQEAGVPVATVLALPAAVVVSALPMSEVHERSMEDTLLRNRCIILRYTSIKNMTGMRS